MKVASAARKKAPRRPGTRTKRPERNLAPLARETYDLVVIGGGITGATVFWDATLRGMKVLLLEKNDYASGTTQATSKLIHGGLRYLRTYEFGLVRESLRERRTLARIAPHAVRPEGFLMPFYKHYGHGRATLGMAVWIYDALSYDRNRGLPQESRVPRHQYLDRDSTLIEEPVLVPRGLSGSYVYYDFANLNPERLCCEFIFSARARGGAARNYVEVENVRRAGPGYEIEGRDRMTGQQATFAARTVLNAAGPWADFLEERTLKAAGKQDAIGRRLIRSKGVHIITRKVAREKALALTLPGKKKQHFFVLPWRGKSIIGTTDTDYADHPDSLRVTEDDIDGLLSNVNAVTRAGLRRSDVEYTYAGLRPLVDEGGDKSAKGGDTYNASRKTEIEHHANAGFPGYFTARGGKYTTSRLLAEQIVDRLAEFLPDSFADCTTARTPLGGGDFGSIGELEDRLLARFPDRPFPMIQSLVSRYGGQAGEILASESSGDVNGAGWRLDNGETFYPAELEYLARNDEIQNLSDLYYRRAGLGTAGLPERAINRQIAERVGGLLGWSRDEVSRELKSLEARRV